MQVEFRGRHGERGAFRLNTAGIRCITRLEPSFIRVTERGDAGRADVERLIEDTYRSRFGSTIAEHYPSLMSVHDAQGCVLAAVGFRCAADGPLFLEHYLKEPVEVALRATAGDVDRSDIIEIGGLASAGRGASGFLFVALAAYLKELQYRFAAVTATASLRRAFAFFGFDPVTLASADRAALADGGHSWGSYYAHNPKVLAAEIAPCFSKLAHFLPTENADRPAAQHPHLGAYSKEVFV